MLKKDITFTDFNENVVTKTYYFNLTKTELIKLEISQDGGMAERVKAIIEAKSNAELVEIFDKIILGGVGKRSDDGERFDKSDTIREQFKCSAAYDALFIEFITDSNAGADFINGLLPKGVDELRDKILAAHPVQIPVDPANPAFQALQKAANESRGSYPPPPPTVVLDPDMTPK